MRRALPLLALTLALALVMVPRTAGAFGLGIAAYGGGAIPLSQNDASSGGTYGVRLPIALIPLISVEPYWGESKLGSGDAATGFDYSSFGLNAVLGSLMNAPGIKFYPYVGIASSNFSGSVDITKTSYNFGLGGALGLSRFAVHGRAELNVVDTGNNSRQFTNLTLALSYDLIHK
jgi:hypothetical protein